MIVKACKTGDFEVDIRDFENGKPTTIIVLEYSSGEILGTMNVVAIKNIDGVNEKVSRGTGKQLVTCTTQCLINLKDYSLLPTGCTACQCVYLSKSLLD